MPLRLGQYYLLSKFIGIKNHEFRARYVDDRRDNEAMDQNSLLIIALEDYFSKTKDTEFAKKVLPGAIKAFDWLKAHTNSDAYLEQKPHSDWLDSIDRSGAAMFSNVCFWKASESLYKIYKLLKIRKQERYFKKISEAMKKNLLHLHDSTIKERYQADGIILGLMWGLYPKAQGKELLAKLTELKGNNMVIPAYPKYPNRSVDPFTAFLGLSDYHREMIWLWISACEGLARLKYEGKNSAQKTADEISELILRYGQVYEVYGMDKVPIKRFVYKSEHPFAWSAGLCVKLFKELKMI